MHNHLPTAQILITNKVQFSSLRLVNEPLLSIVNAQPPPQRPDSSHEQWNKFNSNAGE
jgi:hypothetical protein